MLDSWQPPSKGPIDDRAWPEVLIAKAIAPTSSDDRLHGYAALGDLARHTTFSDTVYLAVVGELPASERSSRLFRVSLATWGSVSVAEAPTHVGVLGRICGATFAAATGAGIATLAEQAQYIVNHHADLLAWLAQPSGPLPAVATSQFCAEWLETLLQTAVDSTLVRVGMTRNAARLALLYEAGVHQSDQMQAVIILAGASGVIAETLKASSADLPEYPITLPPFHYLEAR